MAYKKRRWRHNPKMIFPHFNISLTKLHVVSHETKQQVGVVYPSIHIWGRVGETYALIWEGEYEGEKLKVEFIVESEKQSVEVVDLSVSDLYYLGSWEIQYTSFHRKSQIATATVLTKRK